MIQYPLEFKVTSTGDAPLVHPWSTAYYPKPGEAVTYPVAIPPEFEGPGGGLSPEDLYALALINCFVATFKVIAEKSKMSFKSLVAEGLLKVDRGEGGAPWMSAFHLQVRLTGCDSVDRAKRLLEKTSQSCLILNSVKTVKTFDFEVS